MAPAKASPSPLIWAAAVGVQLETGILADQKASAGGISSFDREVPNCF